MKSLPIGILRNYILEGVFDAMYYDEALDRYVVDYGELLISLETIDYYKLQKHLEK